MIGNNDELSNSFNSTYNGTYKVLQQGLMKTPTQLMNRCFLTQ